MVSIDQPLLAPASSDDILAAVAGRVAAYVSLTKPRLVTPGSGDGSRRLPPGYPRQFIPEHAPVAGRDSRRNGPGRRGRGALNQWLERERDARMRRTSNRTSGRPAGTVGGRGVWQFARPVRDGGLTSSGPTGSRPRSRW